MQWNDSGANTDTAEREREREREREPFHGPALTSGHSCSLAGCWHARLAPTLDWSTILARLDRAQDDSKQRHSECRVLCPDRISIQVN